MFVYVYKERRQISNTFVVVSVISVVFRIRKFYLLEENVYVCVMGGGRGELYIYVYIYIYACMYVFLSVYLYSKSSNRLRCFIYFTNWPDSTLSKHITGQLINIDSYRCMYVSICVCIYIYVCNSSIAFPCIFCNCLCDRSSFFHHKYIDL